MARPREKGSFNIKVTQIEFDEAELLDQEGFDPIRDFLWENGVQCVLKMKKDDARLRYYAWVIYKKDFKAG
jgi:hypothetical protein